MPMHKSDGSLRSSRQDYPEVVNKILFAFLLAICILIMAVIFLSQNIKKKKKKGPCYSLAYPDMERCAFLLQRGGLCGVGRGCQFVGGFGREDSCHPLVPAGRHSDPWSLWRRGSSPRWQALGRRSNSGGKWVSPCMYLLVSLSCILVFNAAWVSCRGKRDHWAGSVLEASFLSLRPSWQIHISLYIHINWRYKLRIY